MKNLHPMIDMRLTPEEKAEESTPSYGQREYPYGLCISLSQEELEKLEVDHGDWQVGDNFHLFAFAKVTSISKNETENGECCRIELQITHLSGESEDDENEQEDQPERVARKQRLFG